MSEKTRGLWRNSTSLAGAVLAFVSFANIIFLFFIDMIGGKPRPYFGIFYMALPAVLVVGLGLFPVGMLLERRRRRRTAPAEILPYPVLDFNDPRRRRAFGLFASATFVLLLLSGVGTYRVYEITDSVAFCGQLCHTPMHPEFAAYQASPHARVKCSECHVGSGATSYARAKFSGVSRAYATVINNFTRPILAPASKLEPARDTCEQCHWPEKFFGAQLKVFNHFASDDNNTPMQIRMLVNTGGGGVGSEPGTGIHWHMNIANEITYVAADDNRQVIPWVRLRDGRGRVTDYLAGDSPMTAQQLDNALRRKMDCMDCHNRSAHSFGSADRALDEAFASGRLDPSLPFLKQQAVDAVSKSYSSTAEAEVAISRSLGDYYRSGYPDIYSGRGEAIDAAVREIQRIYKVNFFPEMRSDWRTHPDNIGHMYSQGCFRCHDDQHVSPDGKVIRKDCNICHTVLDQKQGAAPAMGGDSKSFRHPVDVGDLALMNCADCHTGRGIGQ